MQQVLGARSDTAEYAENSLDEQRRFKQAPVKEMGERIEMSNIVAFAFEAGSAAVAKLSDEEKKTAETQKTALDAQVKNLLTPWMRYFLTFDPQATLGLVHCPVLAINGAKDLQVAADVNLPAIEKALRAGGNQDVTVKELPNLNHLFQTSKTGNIFEYGQIEETISPAALAVMGDWIENQAHKATPAPTATSTVTAENQLEEDSPRLVNRLRFRLRNIRLRNR